ncbi:Aristolochene synthase [Lasiodiplodia hormozganensis]|uniref:Terpene synthase n=1 Tax=Lasiodiplodia hormozganensis TaxID=869390 RepID=A0AA39TGR6_9PEZI|nr:Aristolochene synthase [Lasiodiplodia hormozganensis]
MLSAEKIQALPAPKLEADLAPLPPPPRYIQHKRHPREEQTVAEVDGWFLQHWPFASEKARKKFVAAGFSTVTCLYFPLALDDRIHSACRLLTILFLIDDILEDMNFAQGKAYNDHLMPIMRGDVAPDPSVPCEWMMHEIWDEMRKADRQLADEILEPTFTFMRAQTDKERMRITSLGQYLEYRERDVGRALLAALQRYVMALRLSPTELASVREIEMNCSKHLSAMNDIHSFDKELRQAEVGDPEGSFLCTGVKVVSDESGLDYDASKRVLYLMCREWELVHKRLEQERRAAPGFAPALELYIKGLEYQMGGNEQWSETTERYRSRS